MRAGIVILPEYRWPDAKLRWCAAEEYGFDHEWTFDHLGWRSLVDGPWFGAVPTLTAAAAVTTRIRLGTLVASPNVRHPVPFARELTALDDISDGRFIFGVGSGSDGDYDSGVVGVRERLTGRTRRFGEFVELLDALLTTDRVKLEGRVLRGVGSAHGDRLRSAAPAAVRGGCRWGLVGSGTEVVFLEPKERPADRRDAVAADPGDAVR